MNIKQLKKWCKEQAEYYEGEMDIATESDDEEYYKYCDGMQYAYWSVYHKIEVEHKKLKACPFCGSKNVSDMNGWVQCLDCNASGPDSFDHLIAIDAWNKRS